MKIILLLLTAAPLFAQPSIVQTTPSVVQGGTINFTATGGTAPYTWSLRGGSAGSIVAGTGVYTAPAAVTRRNKVGPCQMMPPDHIYNTRIDALPAHANSNTIINLGGTGFHLQFEPAFWNNITTNSSSTYAGNFYYTPLNNATFKVLEWLTGLRPETGVFMPYFNNTDNHETYVNRETCEFTDIYNRYPAGTNVIQACPLCTGQSGVSYSSAFVLPTTGATDAAGMAQQPVAPGLSQMQTGAITSAMRFTMSNSYIKSSYVWPATANAYPFCTGTCWEYGMYARLKSSVNISGFSARAQLILTALKRYGMVMTDGGTSWATQPGSSSWMDYTTRAAMEEIFGSALRNTDFEVVDTSSMKIADASGAVKIDNGYETPAQYAEVIVTDAATAEARVRVNLQSIDVGVPTPIMTVMGGHTVNLTAWATNTATQTFTWSMSPTVGTLNSSSGAYTAPTGLSVPTTTRVTVASTVDATAVAYIDITAWPDADGAFRLEVGKLGGDTVLGGKTFFREEYQQPYGFGFRWGSGTAGTVYEEARYGYGDLRYDFNLPNGNYKATLYISVNAGSGAIAPDQYVCHLDSNGQLAKHDYSLGRATGFARFTGGTVEIPVMVTDGTAYVALRYRGPSTVSDYYCNLAALSIVPDATTPFLEIDDGDALGADMTISQTRQLYAVGWYMSNSVTWSVVSGSGSIDSNGLYTASSTPPLAASPVTVTVRATSTVDGSKTADYTFDFVHGTITVAPVDSSLSRGESTTFTAAIGSVAYTNVTWSRSGSQGTIGSSSGIFIAPGIITDATITITATDNIDGTQTGTTNLTLSQIADPIRISCGRVSPYSTNFDDGTNIWTVENDYYSTPPDRTYSDTGATITGAPAGQEGLYQYSRYGYPNESFYYTFTVPAGLYSVTLKMAEYRATNQGVRMNVTIAGTEVLTNYDPVAEAGGVRKAIDRTFTVASTGATMVINFEGVPLGGMQVIGAQINAIEIQDLGPIPPGISISGGVVVVGGVEINQ